MRYGMLLVPSAVAVRLLSTRIMGNEWQRWTRLHASCCTGDFRRCMRS